MKYKAGTLSEHLINKSRSAQKSCASVQPGRFPGFKRLKSLLYNSFAGKVSRSVKRRVGFARPGWEVRYFSKKIWKSLSEPPPDPPVAIKEKYIDLSIERVSIYKVDQAEHKAVVEVRNNGDTIANNYDVVLVWRCPTEPGYLHYTPNIKTKPIDPGKRY